MERCRKFVALFVAVLLLATSFVGDASACGGGGGLFGMRARREARMARRAEAAMAAGACSSQAAGSYGACAQGQACMVPTAWQQAPYSNRQAPAKTSPAQAPYVGAQMVQRPSFWDLVDHNAAGCTCSVECKCFNGEPCKKGECPANRQTDVVEEEQFVSFQNIAFDNPPKVKAVVPWPSW